MRIQGGTNGILAMIFAGRLDPLCPMLDEEIHEHPGRNGADVRASQERNRRRVRRWSRYERLARASEARYYGGPCPS